MDDVDLLSSLPGFRDYFPEYWSEISFILNNMREVALKYGYVEYEGPSIEQVALIEAKSGEGLMKEIFQLTDRNDRRLLLRPEQTPTLARMLAREQQRFKRPIRWFSIPRLFRDETIQRGREREFWQLNVDILGEDSVSADAETITVAVDIVRKSGLTDEQFRVYINHRNLLNQYISALTDIPSSQLIPIIDKKMTLLQERISDLLIDQGIDEQTARDNGLNYRRIINSKGDFKDSLIEESIPELLPLLDNYEEIIEQVMLDAYQSEGLDPDQAKALYKLTSIAGPPQEFLDLIYDLELPASCDEALAQLKELAKLLDAFGVTDPIIFDASMARGLDYYTGIVYEAFDATGEVVRAIFGGGRYGDLVESIGGSPLSGVGFGMGETVLLELVKLHNALPADILPSYDIYILPIKEEPIPKVIELAKRLRKEFSVICNPFSTWKVPRHFENADLFNAKIALILGKRDIENGVISVRFMSTGEQTQIPFDQNIEGKLRSYLDEL